MRAALAALYYDRGLRERAEDQVGARAVAMRGGPLPLHEWHWLIYPPSPCSGSLPATRSS